MRKVVWHDIAVDASVINPLDPETIISWQSGGIIGLQSGWRHILLPIDYGYLEAGLKNAPAETRKVFHKCDNFYLPTVKKFIDDLPETFIIQHMQLSPEMTIMF